jgi:hypothetical protein
VITPGPYGVTRRPDGIVIVVGRANDNGAQHTMCEVHPCVDGPHGGREWDDALAIAAALNRAWLHEHDST